MKKLIFLMIGLITINNFAMAKNGIQSSKEQKQKSLNLKIVTECTKAIELNGNDVKQYLNRAEAKHRLQDYLGAIADYDKTIDLKSDDPKAYFYRGTVYFDRGNDFSDYQSAIDNFNEAIVLNSKYAEVYFKRGLSKLYYGKNYFPLFIDHIEFRIAQMEEKRTEWNLKEFVETKTKLKNNLIQMKSRWNKNNEEGCMDLSKAGELGLGEAYDMIKKFCQK